MRLFAAVWPPPQFLPRLRALSSDISGARRRPVPDGSWHVTLAFFGEVDDPGPLAGALGRAAASVTGPVRAELGPGVVRLGRHVLCLPVRGLDQVAAAVRREAAAWIRPDGGRFTGHLTLGRERGASAEPAFEHGGVHGGEHGGEHGGSLEVGFDVASLSLVCSVASPEGRAYRDLSAFGIGTGAPTMPSGGNADADGA